MVKSHVKVYVRTRPVAQTFEGLKVLPDHETITLHLPKSESAGVVNNQLDNLIFKYDSVLENVSQEAVYTSCAHEVVDSVLSGFNCTIFCYGQTGAGKTFTMAGDLRNYHHRGVIPRALHHIFRDIDLRVDRIYKAHVSYMEIYNETLYDLLSENPGTSDSLAILDDTSSNTYVRGLTRVEVKSEEEALAQFFVGDQGRSTAAHVLNSSSSRSHAIFTLYLETRTSSEASERAVLSKLHLVDLAGSERTKKTNVTGQTLKEANFINKSLSFLEQTVNALSRKDNHIPFRQSKLTSVLRDALGGNCKTVMIANIWGEPQHIEETISTLRFASRVKTLVTDVGVTESSDPVLLVRKYERQIKELKQELAMRDTLSGRGRVAYGDMTDSEMRDLASLVMRFMKGDADVDELPVDTLKHIRETYKAMRNVYQQLRVDMEEQLRNQRLITGDTMGGAKLTEGANGDSVGDMDREGRGFHIGEAPADARPAAGVNPLTGEMEPRSPTSRPVSQAAAAAAFSAFGGDDEGYEPSPAGGDDDRNAIFLRFKHATPQGSALNNNLKERMAAVKDLKQQIKDVGATVNSSKHAIDALTAKLALKSVPPTAATAAADDINGDVIDAEAYGWLQQLKVAKAAYRTAFEKLKELRSSLEPGLQGIAEARQKLVDEFNNWFATVGQLQMNKAAGQYGEVDELDPGEAFDKMQFERIVAFDPDSTAYYAARKKTLAGPGKTAANKTGRS